MITRNPGTVCLLLAAFGTVLSAQSPAPPPAPPAPPRVVTRGRSATSRMDMKRGYLGIGVVELTGDRARSLGLKDETGVEVRRVDPNSPAEKAGVKEGDVILEIDGEKIAGVDQFVRSIGESAPGRKTPLAVWRNGARTTLTATLEERTQPSYSFDLPDMDELRRNLDDLKLNLRNLPQSDLRMNIIPGQSARMGFEGETLTDQLADYFGVKQGVLVRSVDAKSPADKGGLKAGDVIVKVNTTPVSSPREISAFVKAGQKLTLTVVRNHKEVSLHVEIAEMKNLGPSRLVV